MTRLLSPVFVGGFFFFFLAWGGGGGGGGRACTPARARPPCTLAPHIHPPHTHTPPPTHASPPPPHTSPDTHLLPSSTHTQYFLGIEAVFGGSGNPAYPGGQFFNLFNMGKTEAGMKELKAKELENGRLAMLAM